MRRFHTVWTHCVVVVVFVVVVVVVSRRARRIEEEESLTQRGWEGEKGGEEREK